MTAGLNSHLGTPRAGVRMEGRAWPFMGESISRLNVERAGPAGTQRVWSLFFGEDVAALDANVEPYGLP